MKFKKKGLFDDVNYREVLQVAGEVRPDDGLDPREEGKRRRRERREERPGHGHAVHKQEQFHSQVQMAIEAALQTAVEPVLNALTVQEVVPQRGSLVVILTPQETDEPVDAIEAAKAVEQAASMLRREVAESITRKETPHLSFVVLPAGAQKVVD